MTERVLIDGYTFLVSSPADDAAGTDGLYHRDTRYLSSLSVSLSNASLSFVGSDLHEPWHRTIRYANVTSNVNQIRGSEEQKHTQLVVAREQAVAEGRGLVDRVTLTNHSTSHYEGQLSVAFDVDFADLFEVRGIEAGIDRTITTSVGQQSVTYEYSFPSDDDPGELATTVAFSERPDELAAGSATFAVTLDPQESFVVTLAVDPRGDCVTVADDASGVTVDGDTADGDGDGVTVETDAIERSLDRERNDVELDLPTVSTGVERYDAVFEQAAKDLRALSTTTDHGVVALAGVPWFATIFGRDALITAYQALPVAPALARGTLTHLAANQGRAYDEFREEEPGKVFHENRNGEFARRGLIPHHPYYGTVDATPLWVVLLHETYRWTGDDDLVSGLRPNLDRALDWIADATDQYGDDPFLYYRSSTSHGLSHKAWRDTEQAVQFADGTPADTPIASVEVQGYVYAAYRCGAALAERWGETEDAERYRSKAAELRSQFNDEFWLPDREYYAVAKTADGEFADSVTSNVGQCLFAGVVNEANARSVIRRLLDDLYSGWGIRTMSPGDAGYSPISYHVGSVWPHDNSLIALGASRYGFHDAAERIATDVLDAVSQFEHGRVPELFCGFDDSVRPHAYPSACEPQAWGAGTPYALLRALSGLDVDGDRIVLQNEPEAMASDAIDPVLSFWCDRSDRQVVER